MTSRNVKSTWELAGRLASSFSESTKKAQTQLGQLRREYRQNQGELRRMQGVMRTAAQGTDAYANAQRRIPQLQDDLNRQAFAIGDLEKESLGGARAQERLSGATGRASSGLKGLKTFGLAAAGAIGIAAGAVTMLTKALNSTGREAQQLQALSTRGIDTQSYQRAASQMRSLTGDAASARQAIQSAADASQSFAQRLAFKPDFSPDEILAVVTLGFDGVPDFVAAGQDIEGMIGAIREEWAGATEQERQAMRQAAQIVGIQATMIDGVAEINNLLERQAALRGRANAGDLDAAAELDDVAQRIARVNSGLGVLTQGQIEAAERYSESAQLLSQAGQDLKNAFVTSFADDFAKAARVATDFILKASELWDLINGERLPLDQRPGLEDYGNLLAGNNKRPASDYLADVGNFIYHGMGPGQVVRKVQDAAAGAQLVGNAALDAVNWLNNLSLPSFSQGGVVPGPKGRPQLAMVHGGEEVVPASDRGANGAGMLQQTNYFQIDGAASPMAVAEEVADVLRRELAGG